MGEPGRPWIVGLDAARSEVTFWRPAEPEEDIEIPRTLTMPPGELTVVVDDVDVDAMTALLDPDGQHRHAPLHDVLVRGWEPRMPVVAPSGRRPKTVRRAAWAAARRLDTLKRRRLRRAGRPLLRPPVWREVFEPAARVQSVETDNGMHLHFEGGAAQWW